MNIKIVIATHKQVSLPDDSLYLPVQVNAELNAPIPGYQPDNEGDNISVLNYRFSELTALWWAWKNLESDYIGMCQYRRLFCTPVKRFGKTLDDVLTMDEAEAICSHTQIVLPSPRNYRVQTLAQHFRGYSFAETNDVDAFRCAIRCISAEYLPAFDRVMARRWGHMCNMHLMERGLLDEYCGWLFAVMAELDRTIDKNRTRILGYFAEHMLDIWIQHNGLSYEEIEVVYLDKGNEFKKRIGYALRLAGLKNASDRLVGRQT